MREERERERHIKIEEKNMNNNNNIEAGDGRCLYDRNDDDYNYEYIDNT